MTIPFVDYQLYTSVLNIKNKLKEDPSKIGTPEAVSITNSRSSTILPTWIGETISVYNGRVYSRIYIKEGMQGHCLGEFVFTKKIRYLYT